MICCDTAAFLRQVLLASVWGWLLCLCAEIFFGTTMCKRGFHFWVHNLSEHGPRATHLLATIMMAWTILIQKLDPKNGPQNGTKNGPQEFITLRCTVSGSG